MPTRKQLQDNAAQLVELNRELARVAVAHGMNSPQVAEVRAKIAALSPASRAGQADKATFDPTKLSGLLGDDLAAQEAWEAANAEIDTEKLLRHLREWRQELAHKAAEADGEAAQRLQAKLAEIDTDINDAGKHLKALLQERQGSDKGGADAKQNKGSATRNLARGKGEGLILTARQGKLLDAAAEIATTPPSGEDMAFTHAVLCQVGLPRAKVDGERFLRQSGAAWLNVQAGYLDEGKGPVLQPIPYGVIPRLALAWVSTYAKRYSTSEIPIGDSAADFLRLMGMDDQGARYATLRKQMHALAACRLQLGFKGRTFNGQPIEQFDAWVSNNSNGQRSLWPGVMTLSEHYFWSRWTAPYRSTTGR